MDKSVFIRQSGLDESLMGFETRPEINSNLKGGNIMKYEIYKDRRGEWRWRLRARNGEVIASGEGYRRRVDCVHSIRLIKKSAKAVMIDLVEEEKKAAKAAKKKTTKRKTAKRKTAKRKTAKRKTKRKTAKRKTKRKAAKRRR